MTIAITSTGPDLEARVDPRFGRCPFFLLVEPEDLRFEAMENPNVALGGGAGIQSAQLMAERGVQQVLTGNCGPNAHQTLSAAGIEVIVGCSGPVRQVVEQYRAGRLAPAGEPNVASHFGTSAAVPVSPPPMAGPSPAVDPMTGGGMGRGMGGGGGMGRGRGGGRGMGGGMGRGMGRGMGMGMGRGGGRGMGGGMAFPASAPADAPAPADELSLLQQQAEAMAGQMQQIQQRIQQIQQDRNAGGPRPATNE